MPQETKSKAEPHEHETVQGLTATADDPEALWKAVQLALDYRGDVTITRRSTGEALECFIFDVKNPKPHLHASGSGAASDEPVVRTLSKTSDDRIAVPLSDISSIAFTGRDTAAGKSFETWMKNYVKKKLAGEEASIHSESLM